MKQQLHEEFLLRRAKMTLEDRFEYAAYHADLENKIDELCGLKANSAMFYFDSKSMILTIEPLNDDWDFGADAPPALPTIRYRLHDRVARYSKEKLKRWLEKRIPRIADRIK